MCNSVPLNHIHAHHDSVSLSARPSTLHNTDKKRIRNYFSSTTSVYLCVKVAFKNIVNNPSHETDKENVHNDSSTTSQCMLVR